MKQKTTNFKSILSKNDYENALCPPEELQKQTIVGTSNLAITSNICGFCYSLL